VEKAWKRIRWASIGVELGSTQQAGPGSVGRSEEERYRAAPARVVVVSRRLVRAMARRFQFAGGLAGLGFLALGWLAWRSGGSSAAQVASPQQRFPSQVAASAPPELRAPETAAAPGALSSTSEQIDEPPSNERREVEAFSAGSGLTFGQVDFDDVLPMSGLSGARILSGGKVIGTSDERGLALCACDGPIEEFEVELPGWSVLAVDRFRSHFETPDGLGFAFMARD